MPFMTTHPRCLLIISYKKHVISILPFNIASKYQTGLKYKIYDSADIVPALRNVGVKRRCWSKH